jgi:hypothetical protein
VVLIIALVLYYLWPVILTFLVALAGSMGLTAESRQLTDTANSIASLFEDALSNHRHKTLEITIHRAGHIEVHCSCGYKRDYTLADGVTIQAISPPPPSGEDDPRRFLVLSGVPASEIALELVDRRGMRRVVRLDRITAMPRIERVKGP